MSSSLISPDISEELEADVSRTAKFRRATEVLKKRSGDDLQFTFRYTPDEIDIYYVNQTLLGKDLLPRLDKLRDRALEMTDTTAATATTAYGDLETLIAAHTDVVIIYFIAPDDEGLIAVIDRTDEGIHGSLI